eukprot:2615628-Rhodomonas_salina.1
MALWDAQYWDSVSYYRMYCCYAMRGTGMVYAAMYWDSVCSMRYWDSVSCYGMRSTGQCTTGIAYASVPA